MKIEVGQTFIRERGFRRPDDGRPSFSQWWIVRVRNLPGEKITGHGTEFIHIDEIVETAAFGPLVIYRHWIVNPDGDDVRNSFTPRRTEHLFRPRDKLAGALATMGMELVSADLPMAA